jgi:flagellar hook-associated protein 2
MAGFGTITSQGVGSNLDIAGIVSRLMDIERLPLQRLEEKKTSYDARISALGSITSKLSALQSSLTGLKYGTSFLASNAQSSDTSLVKATGGSGAIAGNYSIEVSQLAQSQKLVAAGQADATAAIGSGTLTIDLGTISGGTFDDVTGTYSGASYSSNGSGPFNIVIDSSNNTLEGIRDAINDANIGVSATIVNDGDATNPYRLVLSSSNSGADQSIKMSVTGDASLANLLDHDPAGVQNLSETITAQDAIFNVDGIDVTKSSNTVTDVIQGVTLELMGQTSGTPVTVSASQDTESVTDSIKAFIEAYNELQGEIKKLTDSGFSGNEVGALASDSATRQILASIRDELNTSVTGITGSYTTLSSIGVAFQKDGTLSLDETQLTTALQTDRNNVAELFSATEGYATRLDSVVFDLLAVDGTIASRTEGYQDRIKTLEDRKFDMESRLVRVEERLRARFTNLDVLVSSISMTSNYLSQQLDILNAQTSG